MKRLMLLVSLLLLSCTHSDKVASTETNSIASDRQIAQRGRRRPHEINVVEDDASATSEESLEEDASLIQENASVDEVNDDTGNIAIELEKALTVQGRKRFAANYGFDPIRGQPSEYDPGPPPGSKWASLFAQTPNYRSLGVQFLGGKPDDEKFRWTFGPMFYRGRLQPGRVKVFVVGQEGAQDESVSNRSFTGGTGARMQHFLNLLGIHEDYLFMNTFVYTINGQYNKNQNRALYYLAQDPSSPLVKHRHEMFNYMLETNKDSLRLVIAVGAAARDTVATWVRSHSKNPSDCRFVDEAKVTCDGSALGQGIKVIGVPHPGGLGKGADADKLMGDFKTAYTQIVNWNIEEKGRWLKADKLNGKLSGMTEPARYKYGSAPVPFRDFGFATTWRLGRGGTSSNRKDKQASIQIFSEAGCYNADCTPGKSPRLKYKRFRDTDETSIEGMPKEDIPWEAPRTNPDAFDPGPSPEFAHHLMGLNKNAIYPKFWKMGATTHPTFGMHGPYRGRLDEAAILVIADQESNDDLFTGRAWSGFGGQRLQAYLAALGIHRSYAIIKTLPIDTFDVSLAKRKAMALDPQMHLHRTVLVKSILAATKKKKIPHLAVFAIGPIAAEAVDMLADSKVIEAGNVIKLPFPQGESGLKEWSAKFPLIRKGLGSFKDPGPKPAREYNGEDQPIARIDLPIQTKWWVGSTGSRGYRANNAAIKTESILQLDPNYYKLYMPKWVFDLSPTKLSAKEVNELKGLQKEMDAATR